MKRSTVVTLALVGVVGGVAIHDDLRTAEMRRNYYADRAACERDYSVAQCEMTSETVYSSGTTFYHGWYGPSYAADRSSVSVGDPGPGRVGGIATAVHSGAGVSTRGGFGGTAHAGGSARA